MATVGVQGLTVVSVEWPGRQ